MSSDAIDIIGSSIYNDDYSNTTWKDFCVKFGRFKQDCQSWFNCNCGCSMIDNKTSVTYHLLNVCKAINENDRHIFSFTLNEYHKVNPIPKKKQSEWKTLAIHYGKFKRHFNRKVYECKCNEVVSYKKNDVVVHLLTCMQVDKHNRDLLGSFIKTLKVDKRPLASSSSSVQSSQPKLVFPLPDQQRITEELSMVIASLQNSYQNEEITLQYLEELDDRIGLVLGQVNGSL